LRKGFRVVIEDEFTGKEEEIFKSIERPTQPICLAPQITTWGSG